ncbi:MAG: hypothetical protein LH603_06400 [Pseudonocardia sp.]|nr:hypothetical protein [Pseudonocardia sp.]
MNPDHVVVEGDGTIVEHRVGDKSIAIRARAGGGTERVTATAAGPCLSDARIQDLVALGRRVEARFGAPQDIEWAMDGDGDGDGGLWLTQSRPITTLYPLPVPTRPSLRVYVCVSLAQGLTRPMTPMGLSACRVITSTGAVRAFGVPVDDPLASRVGRPVMLAALDVMEARSAVVLRGLLREPELSVLTTSLARSLWPFVRRVLRVVVGFRMPPLLALSLLRPAAARRHVGRIGERLRATTAPAGAALGAGRHLRAAAGAGRVPARVRAPGRRGDRPRYAAPVRRTCWARWPTTCGSTIRTVPRTVGSSRNSSEGFMSSSRATVGVQGSGPRRPDCVSDARSEWLPSRSRSGRRSPLPLGPPCPIAGRRGQYRSSVPARVGRPAHRPTCA